MDIVCLMNHGNIAFDMNTCVYCVRTDIVCAKIIEAISTAIANSW